MSRRSRTYLHRWVLAGLIATVACGDRDEGPVELEGDEPVPGAIALVLDSPATDDGAVWLRVEGPDVRGALTAAGGLRAFAERDGASLHVALAGETVAGTLATLSVPDVGAAGLYRVAVLEVADGDDALRHDLQGYAVRVEPVRR